MKTLYKFFDKFEDKIRRRLSKFPIFYALIGSIGIILLWRGVWGIADFFGMSALVSAVLGVIILLVIGLFVSFFVGEQIIISGIKEEKRTDEKTAEEIKEEAISLRQIRDDIDAIRKRMEEICEKVMGKSKQ
ncbi:hypothetical protein HZB05_00800 [Candidatus Wolfebacteria bacterium]|nr:hypothetical protein [Candidatus Wolfebacteria bacterium]